MHRTLTFWPLFTRTATGALQSPTASSSLVSNQKHESGRGNGGGRGEERMAGQRGWERRVLMCAQSPSSHNGTTCAVHLPKHHQPKQKQNQTNCNIGSKGFDHVLCPDYKGDNAGPWSVEEVLEHWAKLHFEVCVCVRERVVFKYVVVLCCVVLCCVVLCCVCVCVCVREYYVV